MENYYYHNNLSKCISYKTILSLFSIPFSSQRVLDEHAKYDDILQADMVDHYNNLTLKSVFTLKFFLNESNFNSPPPFHVRVYHMFLQIL